MTNVGRIEEGRVVAVVRLDDLSKAVDLTKALGAGGVTSVEFTFTNPKAAEVITSVREAVGDDAFIGAGTVLDAETARIAILAGAEKMVEADFEQIGNRGIGRDMAAEFGVAAVGAYHHRQRIPAYQC